MDSDSNWLRSELERLFPLSPVPDLSYLRFIDDAKSVLEWFQGLNWKEAIETNKSIEDAVCFFETKDLAYYLPYFLDQFIKHEDMDYFAYTLASRAELLDTYLTDEQWEVVQEGLALGFAARVPHTMMGFYYFCTEHRDLICAVFNKGYQGESTSEQGQSETNN